MASPEDRRKSNRSPGIDAVQSGDGRIELELGVSGRDKQTVERLVPPIIQPPQSAFGEIDSVTYSPDPVIEGGTGAAIVTLKTGATGTDLRGQLRYIYSDSSQTFATRKFTRFQSFVIPDGGTASVVFSVPVNIDPKGNLHVRTVFNKKIIDDVKVNINSTDQLLPPSFTSSPVLSDTTGVSGESISVSFSASGNPSPTATYQWFLNGSPIGGANASSYTTTATGGISAGVTLTNSEGTAYQIAEGQIGIAPFFTGTPRASATNEAVGTELTLEGIVTSGTSPITTTFQWAQGGGNIVGATGQSYTPTNTGALTATATATNVFGSVSSGAVSFGTIISATAAPAFLGTPSASATGVTTGTQVTINNVGATGLPAPSTAYYWTQNDAVIGGANSQSYTPSATGPLFGNVTITNTYGSTGATVSFGTIATADSNFAPYFTGTPAGSTTNPDVGERMTFLTYGSTGLPAPTTTFQWYDDGAAISGATGYAYVLGATGGLEDAEVDFVVTNSGSSYYIIDGVNQPVLSMTRGVQYTFDLSNVSTSHPFRLATTENGSGGQYTNGWTTEGTQGQPGAKAVFIVPADAPATLYYYCGNHSGMGNSINVRTVPATDVTMTGNLTGVVTLTNSQGTTGATIDFGTMLNANITSLSLSNVVAGGTLTATVTYGGTFDSITWTGVTS